LHPRIYGTEIEYGVFSWDLVPQVIDLPQLLEKIAHTIKTLPALRNGGRLYMDHGKHPEVLDTFGSHASRKSRRPDLRNAF